MIAERSLVLTASSLFLSTLLLVFCKVVTTVVFPFAVSPNPLLSWLSHTCTSCCLGIIRTTADDLGTARHSLRAHPKLRFIFDVIDVVSGLALNFSKLVIVPTTVAFSESLAKYIKKWLSVYCPGWECFCVKVASVYLGLLVGSVDHQSF